MTSNYYYLVSSLRNLILDSPSEVTFDTVLSLCKEEMTFTDYNETRKVFIFNDIRNAVNQQKDIDIFNTPSYYSREEFTENLTDTDLFFPFMAEWFYSRRQEKRTYPDLQEIDELVNHFYDNIETFGGSFIQDYFLFELDLQNITTALSLRAGNLPLSNLIIPSGDTASAIVKSSSPDFGLSGYIPWLEELTSLFESEKTEDTELKIEQIRWEWLDERISLYTFSVEIVFAYVVKLQSILRWINLDKDNGLQVLQSILSSIENDIQFPEEFSVIGRKK